jgi:hypothetical protein
MYHGACAHHAGFQSDKQRAALKTIVALVITRLAQSTNFRMATGVAAGHRSVAADANNLPLRIDNDRPHGHLTGRGGYMCLVKRPVHVKFIAAHKRKLR